MFKTIEEEGGGGGPQWMSSHPNPGNRYNAIQRRGARRCASRGNANTGQFQSIQARLGDMSPALTAEQIAQGTEGRQRYRHGHGENRQPDGSR